METFALSCSNCVKNLQHQHQSYIDFKNLLKLFNFVPCERRIERNGIRITTINEWHELQHCATQAYTSSEEQSINVLNYSSLSWNLHLIYFYFSSASTFSTVSSLKNFPGRVSSSWYENHAQPQIAAHDSPQKKIQTKWIFMSEGNVNERCDKSQACYEFESVNCEGSKREKKGKTLLRCRRRNKFIPFFSSPLSNTSTFQA